MAYRVNVIRRGIVIVDGVGSLEEAKEYVKSCNPVNKVDWSDFLEIMESKIELQKINIPDFMTVREFAKKIEIRPAEIVKWLFLRGKIASFDSEIGFEDMREFADQYDLTCEKEGK